MPPHPKNISYLLLINTKIFILHTDLLLIFLKKSYFSLFTREKQKSYVKICFLIILHKIYNMAAVTNNGITIAPATESLPGSVQREAARPSTPPPQPYGWKGLNVLQLPPSSEIGSANGSARKSQSARSARSALRHTWGPDDVRAAAAVAAASAARAAITDATQWRQTAAAAPAIPPVPDVTPAALTRQLGMLHIGSSNERPRVEPKAESSTKGHESSSSGDKVVRPSPSLHGSRANSRPGTANPIQRALQVPHGVLSSGRAKPTVSHTIASLSTQISLLVGIHLPGEYHPKVVEAKSSLTVAPTVSSPVELKLPSLSSLVIEYLANDIRNRCEPHPKLETLSLPILSQIATFFKTVPETSKTASRFFQSKEMAQLFQTSSTMRGRITQIVVGRLNSTRDIQKAIMDGVPIPSFLRHGVRPKQGLPVKGISTLHFENIDLDVVEEESTGCCAGSKNQVKYSITSFNCSDLTASFPHIETLIFNNCSLGKSACLVLEQIPHLRHLSIKNDTKLADDAIAPRRLLLKRLTTLSLDGCQKISNKALIAICQFTGNLTELSLAKTKVTDLHDISKLAALQKLVLAECEAISDEALASFSENSNPCLKIIDLSRCRLSDMGLKNLKMKQLDEVVLRGCGPVKSWWSTKSITYDGVIAAFLQHPKVKVVDLIGILSITRDNKERVENLLRNKKIKDEDPAAHKQRIKNKKPGRGNHRDAARRTIMFEPSATVTA